jgi:hypothetical protein
MADETTRSTLAKITGGIVAVAAAWAVQKAVFTVWKVASGHRPPKPEDGDDSGLAEIAAAAALTGALVALSRVLATRGAARFAARVDAGRQRS